MQIGVVCISFCMHTNYQTSRALSRAPTENLENWNVGIFSSYFLVHIFLRHFEMQFEIIAKCPVTKARVCRMTLSRTVS